MKPKIFEIQNRPNPVERISSKFKREDFNTSKSKAQKENSEHSNSSKKSNSSSRNSSRNSKQARRNPNSRSSLTLNMMGSNFQWNPDRSSRSRRKKEVPTKKYSKKANSPIKPKQLSQTKIKTNTNPELISVRSLDRLQQYNEDYKFTGLPNAARKPTGVKFVSNSTNTFDKRSNHLMQKRPQQGQYAVRTTSILKNSKSRSKRANSNTSNTQLKRCNSLSRKYSISKKFQPRENQNSNGIIQRQFQSLLISLIQKNQKLKNNNFQQYTTSKEQNQSKEEQVAKYTDSLFPPDDCSLISLKTKKKGFMSKQKQNITWMRLSELYSLKQMTIFEESQQIIKIGNGVYGNQDFTAGVTCLQKNILFLQKAFSNQKPNPYGIYIVKIFQQKTWKSIIIDDYIPVVEKNSSQKKYSPAFLKVEPNSKGIVNIWPYLLQKAYANYYSTYESLQFSNVLSLIQQMTDCPVQKIHVPNTLSMKDKEAKKKTQQKFIQKIHSLIKTPGQVILAQSLTLKKQKDRKKYISVYHPIFNDAKTSLRKPMDTFFFLNKEETTKFHQCKYFQIFDYFQNFYIVNPNRFQHVTSSSIFPNISEKRGQSLKNIKLVQNSSTCLRVLKLSQSQMCGISLRQKDSRFYHQSNIPYKYKWVRVILLLKQGEDFRWVNGAYSNKSSINFVQNLEAGEYYLLSMVQWEQTHNYQISVSAYGSVSQITITKEKYEDKSRIVEKGCQDLAQRFGKLNQVNRWICSYNYVSSELGLIIQNINNQRTKGEVTIMRSISGLKCRKQIMPVNMEFFFQPSKQEYGGQTPSTEHDSPKKTTKKKLSTIQIDILAGQSFTVVLKTLGGSDRDFFEAFDFGS